MDEFAIPFPHPLNEAPVTASVMDLVRRVFTSLQDSRDRRDHREALAPGVINEFIRAAVGMQWPGPPSLLNFPKPGELDALFDAPDVSDRVCVRFIGALCSHAVMNVTEHFDEMRLRRPIDLEGLAKILSELGVRDSEITQHIIKSADDFRGGFTHAFADDDVWPFFARRPDEFERVMQIAINGPDNYESPGSALSVLKRFPKPPARSLRVLYDYALSKKKTFRELAKEILSRDVDRDATVREGLATGSTEIRTNAAIWLGEIGGEASLEALGRAADREKNDVARAAIVDAIAKLSNSASPGAPDGVPLEEARLGLKRGIPRDLAWFLFERLPIVHDTLGNPVPREVLTWLIISAYRLKSPAPGELLRQRLEQFTATDRVMLGRYVLDEWIAFDTIPIAPAEADRKARAYARENFGYTNTSEASLYSRMLPIFLEEPFGSAIKAKGILAIAAACCDGDAAAPISAYVHKWYGTRPSHGKSFIEVLAWIDDPRAAQVLFAISDRFRTKSFQEEAGKQIALLAQRKGWSVEELADRTVPSAGFDENGILELACAEPDGDVPVITATLTQDFEILLSQRGDKTIASLAAVKKQLKAITAAQTERLYQAMCGGRPWRFTDFKQFVLGNPIVRALAARLVWATCDVAGNVDVTFRPQWSGGLRNAFGVDVRCDDDATIRLAHDLIVDRLVASAWQKHFSEYAVPALLPQFGSDPFELNSLRKHDKEIANFEGFVLDGFALRNAVKKRDWVRGDSHDANRYYSYERRFSSLGIQAVLSFTGNEVPEDDRLVALKMLYFEKLNGTRRFDLERIPLANVPPILLAEAFNAARSFAAAGDGYDPAWESKAE